MTTIAEMASARESRIQQSDATYKSFEALLKSPAASASEHLELIGANGISASVTHYLSTLPTAEAGNFARVLVTSRAFWSDVQSSEDATFNTRLLPRAKLVFEATARAALARIQVVTQEYKGNLGWSAQRSFVNWLRSISDAIQVDVESIPVSCESIPIPSFAFQTGLVAGLQAARAQRKQQQQQQRQNAIPSVRTIASALASSSNNHLNTSYALRKAEEEWCKGLAECLHILSNTEQNQEAQQQEQAREEDLWEREYAKASISASAIAIKKHKEPAKDSRVVALFLTAQVSPYVSGDRLARLSPDEVQLVLSQSIVSLFEDCAILESIKEDLHGMPLVLQDSSATMQRADLLYTHPLFPHLGALSKLLSMALSGLMLTLAPMDAQNIVIGVQETPRTLLRMRAIALNWQNSWLSCRLSGARQDDIAEESRQNCSRLWQVFKTLLFSYTMVFDALLEAIVDVCPSPTEIRKITVSSLDKYAAEDESNIPPAYLNIVCEVLRTYSYMSWITNSFGSSAFDEYRRVFYEALEVVGRDGRASLAFVKELFDGASISMQHNSARRSQAVFVFDITEQLMAQMPDAFVEDVILPACRPYLDDQTYSDAFESAHSVVLSVFATDKECALELTPYYAQLLLSSFPKRLTGEQITLAYSTVVSAASDRSDSVAWHALELLWREIELCERDPQAIDRYRGLCDVYVSQTANVNLVLLRSLLQRIKRLILHQQRGDDHHFHLCEQTFASLAGLDASTREEGVRWWLQEREAFGL